MKILIRISFIGNQFFGTQKQKDKRTIQGEFEEKLSQIYHENIKVTISSRLDKDVSALDFALTFETEKKTISLDHLAYYLRRSFSDEIFIKEVKEVESSFSPRYDCEYKTYCYLIQNTKAKNPLLSSISYTPLKVLDVDKVNELISLFVGQHDFRYFSSPEGDENTILTIDKAKATLKNGMLYIRFQGKSFLRYQVRFMVGAILSYFSNKLTKDQIQMLLNGIEVKFPKYKAEGKGLFLEKIYYPSIDHDEKNEEIPSVLFFF